MILERFIATRFMSFVLVLFFGLTGLYLLIDAFENLPDFLEANAGFVTILAYFGLVSLRVVYELSPQIILLAGLMTLVTMGKSRELMALRSIGIPGRRIALPIIGSALILCTMFTALKLFMVPAADRAASLILARELGKKTGRGFVGEEGRLYYRGKGSILSADIVMPDASVLGQVEWLFFDRDYQLVKVIVAAEARYEHGKWVFIKGLREEGNSPAVFFDSMASNIYLAPRDLVAVETPVEEASASQLFRAILRLRALSLPYHQQETVLLAQLLYSFLGVSLLFACMPLVASMVQGGAALGLVLGTGLGFTVWALWNMMVSMGKTGAVEPVIAVFGPHALLIAIGIWIRKKYEF